MRGERKGQFSFRLSRAYRDFYRIEKDTDGRDVIEFILALEVNKQARLADGTQIDLELQARHHPGLRERELFYWARMYTTQIGRGDNYLELKPTICIFILNFSDSDSPIFHSIFRVLEIHDHREFSRDLEIHTLELPKLEEEAAHDPESPVLKWGRFFRATTDEELEKLAMADPDMNAAK